MTDTTRTGLPPAAPLRPEGLRLIAVDMDGTFLGAGMPGTYDRARFAPLRRRMRERGVRFVVASGNQEHQIAGYFEGDVGGAALSPDGIVSDNGAIVAAGRRRLLESAMPPEALGAALAVLADYPDIGIIGSGPQGAVVPEDQDPRTRTRSCGSCWCATTRASGSCPTARTSPATAWPSSRSWTRGGSTRPCPPAWTRPWAQP